MTLFDIFSSCVIVTAILKRYCPWLGRDASPRLNFANVCRLCVLSTTELLHTAASSHRVYSTFSQHRVFISGQEIFSKLDQVIDFCVISGIKQRFLNNYGLWSFRRWWRHGRPPQLEMSRGGEWLVCLHVLKFFFAKQSSASSLPSTCPVFANYSSVSCTTATSPSRPERCDVNKLLLLFWGTMLLSWQRVCSGRTSRRERSRTDKRSSTRRCKQTRDIWRSCNHLLL